MKSCQNERCAAYRSVGAVNQNKDKFCYLCGQELGGTPTCCGEVLGAYDRFCTMCGKPTGKDLGAEMKKPEEHTAEKCADEGDNCALHQL